MVSTGETAHCDIDDITKWCSQITTSNGHCGPSLCGTTIRRDTSGIIDDHTVEMTQPVQGTVMELVWDMNKV